MADGRNGTSRRFIWTSHVLCAVCLVFGILALPFNACSALLPAAMLSGWTQIGGL